MSLDELEAMHRKKAGALIQASVRMGAICANASLNQKQQAALITYADAIGLAFQIWDDVLDVEGDTSTLGKSQGKDEANNKPTYPALLGLEGARTKAFELIEHAQTVIKELNTDSDALIKLADYIVNRDH